jgi:hypothetical protein
MTAKGIYLIASVVGKPGKKGGNTTYVRFAADIKNYLNQQADCFVTTMVDYYGIDSNWPGKSEVRRRKQAGETMGPEDMAIALETAMMEMLADSHPELDVTRRVIPYVSMHEFEALLFSDAQVMSEKLNVEIAAFNAVLRAAAGNPEAINDSPVTAPSKRLENMTSDRYRKVLHGNMISEAIGIAVIREKCRHFDAWLTRIEGTL